MNYDEWKTTEPSYMLDEPTSQSDPDWDSQFNVWNDEGGADPMDAYEYPQDTWQNEDDFESLEFKERVVNDLLESMDEFLKFSTFKELMKLIVGNV